MLISSHITTGCFHTAMAELSGCDKDGMAPKPTVCVIWPLVYKGCLSALLQEKALRAYMEFLTQNTWPINVSLLVQTAFDYVVSSTWSAMTLSSFLPLSTNTHPVTGLLGGRH